MARRRLCQCQLHSRVNDDKAVLTFKNLGLLVIAAVSTSPSCEVKMPPALGQQISKILGYVAVVNATYTPSTWCISGAHKSQLRDGSSGVQITLFSPVFRPPRVVALVIWIFSYVVVVR